MFETKEERQVRLLRIFKEYTIENIPIEIEDAFLELEELYQEEDVSTDFWKEVRSTLKSNKHLYDKEVQFFITKYDRSSQGYWWYDSRLW